MDSNLFDQIMSQLPLLLATLGIGFLCGVGPLLIAGISYYSSRKRKKVTQTLQMAEQVAIGELKGGEGLVTVRGKISQVLKPVEYLNRIPLALLRLKAETYDADDNSWHGYADRSAQSLFILRDQTGEIWVDPDHLDKHLMGRGFAPTEEQLEIALSATGIKVTALSGRMRYRCWAFPEGQELTVTGSIQAQEGRLWLGKTGEAPLAITPPEAAPAAQLAGKQAKSGSNLALLLGIPGGVILCGSMTCFLVTLLRVVIPALAR